MKIYYDDPVEYLFAVGDTFVSHDKAYTIIALGYLATGTPAYKISTGGIMLGWYGAPYINNLSLKGKPNP